MGADGLILLISEEELRAGVAELARQIDRDYAETGVVIVCVLKGSIVFASDLVRSLETNVHCMEFIRASSYGDGTTSWGRVGITGNLDERFIRGRHVLIVDDIVDTGLTCKTLNDYLNRFAPASLRYCALLDKPDRREVAAEYDYVGFTIPNHFVVGYGMDLAERYRELPALYYLPDGQ